MNGHEIYKLAQSLWPINRSLTGQGFRDSLCVIKELLPQLEIIEVASGTKVFDWVVPKEWSVREAYIIAPNGEILCDFNKNNLHLVGYSTPINIKISLEELQKHLHSLPDQPDAIPYITSYYNEYWGFCLSHNKRESLENGEYTVVIDSYLFEGKMNYGELIIPGNSACEVFLSTYLCHPSLANNELSGPCVTAFIAKNLIALSSRRYSYRIVFIPETIGSITYLSKNINKMKENIVAGFNISCIGDDRAYSYLPSRNGNTISDIVAQHVLKFICPNYVKYNWDQRGSDERQYCAPGVDLPIASIMRTKYGEYPEYHTSLDNLDAVVTPSGLEGGYNALWYSLMAIEKNYYPICKVLGEPQLGKRGLYPNLSTIASSEQVLLMMNVLTWSDGEKSLIDIANICDVAIWKLYPVIEILVNHRLLDLYPTRLTKEEITNRWKKLI
jgi:aminopeptidase-like protein